MAQKPPKEESLAELYPKLANQWHLTKNEDFTPYDFRVRSGKKVWWKCDKGNDHEWQASISNRTKGTGCPICNGKVVVISNCLATTHPELAKEWHPTKNGELTPYDIVAGTGKKVWWKCDKGEDHEWETSPNNRSRGTSCPICAGQKVVKSNCLATTHPKLVKEWHPTKNGNLTPFDVIAGSDKKVWWKCYKADDHIWEAAINSRVYENGCPICYGRKAVKSNCLATTHPDLAKEWHPTKNGKLTPLDVTAGSNKKIWWRCDKGNDHEWQTTVNNRKFGTGCPVCAGLKVVKSNCLATTHPKLSKEWHPTKNGTLTPFDVIAGSEKMAWWKCDKADDHIWEAAINSRSKGIGCAVCAGIIVVKSNCLATTNPEIAREWHPTKNGELTPYDVTSGSPKEIWWQCDKGEDHIWKVRIANRKGCPICSSHKVADSTSLAFKNPELTKEWHPTKNFPLTPIDVSEGSGLKVWWQCHLNNEHEWMATIDNRSKKKGCPYCTLTPQSKQELTITFELILFFKSINPKGFKTNINGKITSIDIYIPELNLGIEFDGSYWHKGKKEFDKLKTKSLKKEGFDIIRIREEPLKKINENDVISKQPFNGKKVTNDILLQIMKIYNLKNQKNIEFQVYMVQNDLQNEKGLEQYIDMILAEKSSCKK